VVLQGYYMMRPVLSRANRFLVHSAEEKNRLRELLGADTRIEVVRMPAFTEISGRRWKSDEAKARLGVDRPVIATRVGVLAEVIRDGVDGRLVEPRNLEELAMTVLQCLEPETLRKRKSEAGSSKHRFSWDAVVDAVVG